MYAGSLSRLRCWTRYPATPWGRSSSPICVSGSSMMPIRMRKTETGMNDASGARTAVTEATGFETIEFEVADHIATITLNRPDRLNCFNEAMANDMARAWVRVRDDDDIRVAVLRANGERAFCTGVDLSEGAWWADRNRWNQQ